MRSAPRGYARPLDGTDKIVSVRAGDDGELLIEAAKTVRSTDPYLAGHFPGVTLYPAVFLLDGIRQAVGAELHRAPALAAHLSADPSPDLPAAPAPRLPAPAGRERWLELGTLDSARVIRPMLEGDELRLLVRVSAGGPGTLRAALDCRRADDGVQVAKMTVGLVPGGGA